MIQPPPSTRSPPGSAVVEHDGLAPGDRAQRLVELHAQQVTLAAGAWPPPGFRAPDLGQAAHLAARRTCWTIASSQLMSRLLAGPTLTVELTGSTPRT